MYVCIVGMCVAECTLNRANQLFKILFLISS